jgi:hypothetical protein
VTTPSVCSVAWTVSRSSNLATALGGRDIGAGTGYLSDIFSGSKSAISLLRIKSCRSAVEKLRRLRSIANRSGARSQFARLSTRYFVAKGARKVRQSRGVAPIGACNVLRVEKLRNCQQSRANARPVPKDLTLLASDAGSRTLKTEATEERGGDGDERYLYRCSFFWTVHASVPPPTQRQQGLFWDSAGR